MSKITVGKSRIHGNGIFATRNIKKGETAFIIKGKIVRWIVSDQRTSLYGPDWIGIGKEVWIDPKGPAKLLNHSCEPSCGMKGKVKVVALRDMKKGEEITVDYSITEIDRLWYMRCNCKSKNCRKKIQSIQHLPKRIYDKYTPFIPTYFAKVYNRSHENKQMV